MKPFLPVLIVAAAWPTLAMSQTAPPPATDPRIASVVADVSAERIEHTIRTLAGFGTRHTLSDTVSNTRGIGAARRWLKGEFDDIGQGCGGCLEVFFDEGMVRVPKEAVSPTTSTSSTSSPSNGGTPTRTATS